MSLTPLERFNRAIEGRPVDHVPIYPLIGGWAVANFSDHPTSAVAGDPGLMAEAQIRSREEMGYDPVFAYMDAVYVAEAFGCPVRYLETGTVVDPVDVKLRTTDDLGKIPIPDPRTDGRFPTVLQAVSILKDYAGDHIPVVPLFEGPFTTACRVVGSEQVMRMTYKGRHLLTELLDLMTDFLIDLGRAMVEKGADILIIPEPTGSSSMISPRMFGEIVLPGLQRLTAQLRVPWILHMCGDTTNLLDLIVKTGASVLSLDQCMDLSKCRQAIPEAVIGGNVDPINALLMGTPEQVEQDTLRCLEQGGERFVLMSGCGIPPGVPRENVEAMVRRAR